MSEAVLLEVAQGVASLVFNRPQAYNALDVDAILRLRELTERVAADDDVRVLVLRGAGPAFCAGGDVSAFHANLGDFARLAKRLTRELHFSVLAMRDMAKPVIASVHGAVAGAGFSLMCGADLAIAAEGTKFSVAYSRIGVSPDGGGSYFLPRLVGHKRAMELALLSDPVDASTAATLGLINKVVPADRLAAETRTIAERLAAGPSRAYAETKALMRAAFESSLEAHLEAESRAFTRLAASKDMVEGITAFVEKRKPDFRGNGP